MAAFIQRTLEIPGSPDTLRIEVHQPALVDADEYQCKVDIFQGAVLREALAISGADALQALLLAVAATRETLVTQYPAAQWMGLPIDFAFPRTIPHVAGLDVYREIADFADKLLASRFG